MARLKMIGADAGDGLAIVRPGRFVGAATAGALAALAQALRRQSSMRGAIVVLEDGANLDLDEAEALVALGDRAAGGAEGPLRALTAQASALSAALRDLETAGKPVVAVVCGALSGFAAEIALACHHRLAEPGASFAFDQVALGLTPMAGGTQRLPRLAGAEAALPLMLRARRVSADEAAALSIVHRIVAPGDGVAAARAWIGEGHEAVQPWDRKGFALPGGDVYGPQGLKLWPAINALYRKETGDLYEARRGVLKAVYDGLTTRGMDAGLKAETQRAIEALRGSQAGAMLRTFGRSIPALNGGARRPAGVAAQPISRIAVVGAGFMGAGIAMVAARAGLDVVLIDRDEATAASGKAQAEAAFGREVKRGAMTPQAAATAAARIAPSADYARLSGADLAIEAVFENRDVKRPVLQAIGSALAPGCVIGSNTSTLPIGSLAPMTGRPERFVGVHFFSPVERMQLVEIIRGAETADTTVAAALDFVQAIGKTPIVVNDSRGFFTSRVVMTYIAEGHHMLVEGVPPALIENAGRLAGMPVGPLALNDEVALDLAWKILEAARADLGDRYTAGPIDRILDAMVNRHGRFGRKNAKGFYDYPAGGKKRLWSGIGALVGARPAQDADVAALSARLLLIQALETARCLEEGVLADPRDGDVGAILGFGYAPWTGGPLSWIDMQGASATLARCRKLQARYGDRYAPPSSLVVMAATGGRYHKAPPPS